jgi:hypothetical protein
VGLLAQQTGRLRLDMLRVVVVQLPATLASELGERLPVHDRVGPGLIWRAATSSGKSGGQNRSEIETMGAGSAAASSSSAAEEARITEARTAETSAAVAATSRCRLS